MLGLRARLALVLVMFSVGIMTATAPCTQLLRCQYPVSRVRCLVMVSCAAAEGWDAHTALLTYIYASSHDNGSRQKDGVQRYAGGRAYRCTALSALEGSQGPENGE